MSRKQTSDIFKVKLTIGERIALFNLLPERGNYATLKIIDDFKKSLSFSESEFKEYEITQQGPTIKWNVKKDKGKEYKIRPVLLKLLRDKFKELNDRNELTLKQLSAYEKIMGGEK